MSIFIVILTQLLSIMRNNEADGILIAFPSAYHFVNV
jgi:hypothetical protein